MANPLPVIIHQDEVGIKEAVIDLKGSLQGLTFQIATNTKDTRDHLGKIATRMLQIVDAVKTEDPGTDLVPVDGETSTDVVPVDQAGEEQDATKLLEEIATNTRATAFATAKVYEAITMANREASEDVLDPNDAQPVDPNETPLLGAPDAETDTKAKKGILDFLAILFGTLTGAIGGIVLGFAKAFNLVILKPIKAIGGMFKGLLQKILPKSITSGFSKIVGGVTKVFTSVLGFFKSIGNKLKSVASTVKGAVMTPFVKIGEFFAKFKGGAMGGIIDKISKLFNPFRSFFGNLRGFFEIFKKTAVFVSKAVSKIFLPLTIIMASIDTIVGAVKGFQNSEGSLVDKIIGGLMGAVGGLFDFFISWPINLLKNIAAWFLGIFGFDNIKEKLDAFEFSYEWLTTLYFNFVDNIKNWVMGGLKNIGIPPFKFTIWNPIPGDNDWEVGFDGYYPFRDAGDSGVQTDSGMQENTKVPEGSPSGPTEAQERVMQNEGLEEDQFVKVKNVFGLPGGDTMLISKKPNKDTGAYTIISGDGGMLEVADDSGALATMLANIDNAGGTNIDSGSTSGGDIDGATTDANAASEMANASGGGDTAVSMPMTTVGGSTTSVSTTNISSTATDNSLKTRQQKYSW